MGPHRVEPVGVESLLVVRAARDEHGPLAAVLAGGVLPLGLHAFLEEVEVRVGPQPARRLYVIVQAAKKRTHQSGASCTRCEPSSCPVRSASAV